LNNQRIDKSQFEVIVADDGSTDGTDAMVDNIRADFELRYLYQKKKGAAAARNRAIEASHGDIIIFMDSDILPSEDMVGEHIRSHIAEDRIIVQGPVIHTWDLENPGRTSWTMANIYLAFFAAGNSSLYKRYLEAAGGFDEDFSEYGWEDFDLGIRLRKLGLRSRRNRRAIGYHYREEAPLRSLDKLCRKERERGHTAVLFYRKHPTLKVKLQTMFGGPFFFLDRFLTLGGWYRIKKVEDFFNLMERKGNDMMVSLFIKLITSHCYFEGMREELNGLP
jgi:glycosyltransferase involved in cell wall biosynthesis